ncbi:alpha/beta fold hydrolase [Szabonella alba]|uniref:Alpha/beta hydrolase n=1 Tax=Szabonella alba TaxID=2804194 RepID=A0A8K0V8K6_9RHOB|nr:alpha/beta hydrolase [Szabonella alba]MBL4916296.1 alpha/beta hydrolase [Szabonella alba]
MTGAAPFHADLAEGPEGGHAVWLRTHDGVRIRLGIWPAGPKGRVLIFPGRTEYIEKYGRVAQDLAQAGYGSVAVDWRGQGLADRLTPDPMLGHVGRFSDYQHDVAAVLAHLDAAEPGMPRFLLAHSMGGCIGLRALVDGRIAPRAAAFSAPMWGIRFSPGMRQIARLMSGAARLTGRGQQYTPSTRSESHILATPFADNFLTGDEAAYAWMQAHLHKVPALGLGGPGLHWLGLAIAEGRALEGAPLPDLPVLCLLGSRESIVDPAAIHRLAARWPSARLQMLNGAAHELLMEQKALRDAALQSVLDLFDSAA